MKKALATMFATYRLVLILPFLSLPMLSLFGQQGHVLFGTHPHKTMDLFFDGQGSPYPDYLIHDSSLATSGSSLQRWYAEHPLEFKEIGGLYRCEFREFSSENLKELSDSIVATWIQRLNKEVVSFGSITFMVHGFRKPYRRVNYDMSSPEDYEIIEQSTRRVGSGNTLFVGVYWDGMYGCCFSANSKRNKELFDLFEQAQRNAIQVGYGLREVLSRSDFDTLNIFSHSLGAKVVTYALFDPSGDSLPTPTNARVNICLIAPAIDGNELLAQYHQRNSPLDLMEYDNYKLAIVFNKKDFVLRKKDFALGIFGPGPYKYGVTSLGCNHRKAAQKLKAKIDSEFDNASVRLFDFSQVGKCHHVSCYCRGDNLRDVWSYLRE